MKAKILLIYTGGTIGMIKDLRTGELKSLDFNYVFDHIPELERLHVELSSISFEKAIDSSDMTYAHWRQLVDIINDNYETYDGFVVLHGSDTMAYTASALSFMLQGLTKPIILTGSQLPIGTIRTDGKENLITAVEIAAAKNTDGSAIVQEVAIYFEYSLIEEIVARKSPPINLRHLLRQIILRWQLPVLLLNINLIKNQLKKDPYFKYIKI